MIKFKVTEEAIAGLARAGDKEAQEWLELKRQAETKLSLWIKTPEDQDKLTLFLADCYRTGINERQSFLMAASSIEDILAAPLIEFDESNVRALFPGVEMEVRPAAPIKD